MVFPVRDTSRKPVTAEKLASRCRTGDSEAGKGKPKGTDLERTKRYWFLLLGDFNAKIGLVGVFWTY